MSKLCYYIFFLLALASFQLYPAVQDSAKVVQEVRYDKSNVEPFNFEEDELDSYRQDKAFNYVEKKAPDNWWTRFKQWLNDLWASFIDWLLNGKEAKGLLALFIRALPYLILIGVIAFLVWLFMKIDSSGTPLLSKTPSQVFLNEEDLITENKDIQDFINQALKENNYRLAVRFYYLLLLQQLSKKDIIDWQLEKTNHDYVFEIKNDLIRYQFTKVTRIYDFIWYGNFEVDENTFAKAEKEFLNLKKAL